ncbi:MAG: methyltransferase domain-containing protein [Proteobacteria bacterium]|nr:methyltransferase domain-containing protein [Pseudomonadota bacterium]MBU1593908.1 methyltransferase domain-containing protein [Pseudomonadota bacterium]
MKLRGGHPELEMAHGSMLASTETEQVWGWASPAGQCRVRARIEWLTKVCRLGAGVEALECGCGTGIFTRELAKTGASITAADISEDLLAIARQRLAVPNVRFVNANLESPGAVPDQMFDALLGVSVLHHLNLEKALPVLASKLRPGGRFAFSEPNLANPINKHLLFVDDEEKRRRHGISPTEQAFLRSELAEIFRRHGFHVAEVAYKDFLHPSTPRPLIPLVKCMQSVAEQLPLIQRWSGSLWIHGERRP